MASEVVLPVKRVQLSYDTLDRISNLPKELIHAILIHMPIKDAVRTSTLSTSWRYTWMSISQLVFNKTSIPLTFQGGQRNDELVNFINNLLLSEHGAIFIDKFDVRRFLNPCLECDQLIQLLSRKILNHLVLVFKKSTPYQLPDYLFHCKSLRTLELKSCIMSLPSHEYLGFSQLTHLHLRYVTITNQVFESLVAKIPLLIVLELCLCENLTQLIIHAPKLTQFQIKGCWKNIDFKHTSHLKHLHFTRWQPSPDWCRLDKTLAKFDELRFLVISHPRTEFLSIDTAPERLANTYNCLATLVIAFNIHNLKELQAVICLCRSSPRLSMFKILFRVPKNGQHVLLYEGNFWKARLRKREGVFLHLKTIYMDGFSGVRHEIRFIQFILLNAVVLEKFHIRWGKESTITDNEKELVVKNVLQLQRVASRKVIIIFEDCKK